LSYAHFVTFRSGAARAAGADATTRAMATRAGATTRAMATRAVATRAVATRAVATRAHVIHAVTHFGVAHLPVVGTVLVLVESPVMALFEHRAGATHVTVVAITLGRVVATTHRTKAKKHTQGEQERPGSYRLHHEIFPSIRLYSTRKKESTS